ncbi:MAG: sugar phosphate nucleotidyltransferase [Bacteroidota bacterium]
MSIRKAVITAAGRGSRLYPAADTVQKAMLPFVDRDGLTKPLIQIIIEEALSAGVEEVCIVAAPGDEARYRSAFDSWKKHMLPALQGSSWANHEMEKIDDLLQRLHFRVQEDPRGYGDAVWTARDFVGDEPVLLLLGDHLYVSDDPEKSCAQQLVDLALQEKQTVSAVNATPEHLVSKYGTLTGKALPQQPGRYQVERIQEKPALSMAEISLKTPGLRMGYYLCIFGMHVLQPEFMAVLGEMLEAPGPGASPISLTPAFQALADRRRYFAQEMNGKRYDLSAAYGLMRAQMALGLSGEDRDLVLSTLLETLAETRI